jgi:ferredoxin
MCEMAAPTVFAVGDDSQAHVLAEPGDQDHGAVQEAVATCPTAALTIEF